MENSNREIIYLACPLSHPDHRIEIARFKMSCMAAAYLMSTRDCIVFSPLSHSCPIDHYMHEKYHRITHEKLRSHEFWVELHDKYWMDACNKIVILTLKGWDISTGVNWEKKYMLDQGKLIEFLPPAQVWEWFLGQKEEVEHRWI